MKKSLLAVAMVLATLPGCTQYNGSVKVNKIDGKVSTVEVNMPGGFTLHNRDQADRLITHMESLLADVKQARDQMPVVEPQPNQK